MEGNSRQQSFPTTQWSLIARAAAENPAERSEALEKICQLYWPPVYAFIRSRGHTPHDAEDLTQGLFAQLIGRDDFRKLDQQAGKLRSYLLSSAQNHLTNEHRKNCRLKRGGGTPALSLDMAVAEERCLILEPQDNLTPDRIFERQWAVTVMEQVIHRLTAAYADKGQQELFTALSPFLSVQSAAPPQAEIAAQLGLSPQALRVALHRLRQRYAACLRDTVRATLSPDGNVDEEIRMLMAAFT